MTTPLTENPAVVDPAHTLSNRQKDALTSIAFFRYQRIDGGQWQVGNKRFAIATIEKLVDYKLVQRRGNALTLTTAGQLAKDKLTREGTHGNA